MGIFTWIVRASPEELEELEEDCIGTDDVLAWARSGDIQTLASDQAPEIILDRDDDPTTTTAEGGADKESKEPPAKKPKTSDDTLSTEKDLRSARRLDMDKSWDAIHGLFLLYNPNGYGPSLLHEGGSPITIFLTDTSKNHNKFYEITFAGTREVTRCGVINELVSRDTKPLSRKSSDDNELHISPLDSCLETLRQKLQKGYKPRWIGHDRPVQLCHYSGRVPTRLPDAAVRHAASNHCVIIDAKKDSNVKEYLEQQTRTKIVAGITDEPASNAKERVIQLFHLLCWQEFYQPQRILPATTTTTTTKENDERHPKTTTRDFHLAYILKGGIPTTFDMGYGPGRILSADQVKCWFRSLPSIPDLQNIFTKDLEKLNAMEQVFSEWKQTDWDGYIRVHLQALYYFLQCAVEDGHGLLVYLG